MSINQYIFNDSTRIRKLILSSIKINPIIKYEGKAFVCVLVNSHCNVGCSHCMFSATMGEQKSIKNTLTETGMNNLIDFLKASNTGYVLLSSAGEGFYEIDIIYKALKQIAVDVMWVVTSGYWAINQNNTKVILNQLHESFIEGQKINFNRVIYIRISVDSYHLEKLTNDKVKKFQHVINIIKYFETNFNHESNFRLLLHSLENDRDSIVELAKEIAAQIIPIQKTEFDKTKYPGETIFLKMKSGYQFGTTFAKLLYSDLAVNLYDEERLNNAITVFERDINVEHGNPAIKNNSDGKLGPNMLIWYDGSVSFAWQSEMPDLNLNIYHDSFQKIKEISLSDPGTLATIENGFEYRNKIINEVNPKAVIRAKAVNIRDYTSRVLLEENKTKVYYSLRAIQDYVEKGQIKQTQLETFPELIKELIKLSPKALQSIYRKSSYDIIAQFIEQEPTEFKLLLYILEEFFRNGQIKIVEEFIQNIETSNFENLKKWMLLFQRVCNGWYEISSFSEIELSKLHEVLQLEIIVKISNRHFSEAFTLKKGLIKDTL